MSRLLDHLSHFHGGLELDYHKDMSTQSPIEKAELPPELILPVHQHIGDAGEILVNVGERVLKGQPLTRTDAYVSAPVHAPSSGTVREIGERPVPHPSRLSALCITIDTDGKDEWAELSGCEDYTEFNPIEIRNRVRKAGIVGMGGAAFPTAVKLNISAHRIDTLILNGAECEPYISCDDMLMREQFAEVVQGAEIMMHALEARECLIAVEDNKPIAIRNLTDYVKQNRLNHIQVVKIPSRYPTGGEKQLIKVLTGEEVPSSGLPADIGLVVQNIATAVAVYNAIVYGRPLISRIVTVTGSGVEQPRNLEVLIGTPMGPLIEQCGGYTDEAGSLIMGGPMMGFAMQTDYLPVIKGCNCLLVQPPVQQPTAMPCIRCGACASACPASLLPQQLYWHASSRNFDVVQDYNLFDCIECGCCAAVCPSHIPLVQYYRFAKTEIWHQERERQKSDHARQRHEFRLQRLDNEKRERDERLRKKKEALAKKQSSSADDPKKAAIAAAMKRVQEKKAAADNQPSNTENLNPAQQQQINDADQRRQQGKPESSSES